MIEKHVPPSYYGYWMYYKEGYASTVKCKNCFTIGLREDMHPVNPCLYCGGKVLEDGAARWVKPKFNLKGILWWKSKEIISKGYWEKPVFNE